MATSIGLALPDSPTVLQSRSKTFKEGLRLEKGSIAMHHPENWKETGTVL